MDVNFQYLFRALFVETSGYFTLENNITLHLELDSTYDASTKSPKLAISSFSVDYNNFNILFGGSILAYLLDLIEGFCDCVVKEQYPNLLEKVLGVGIDSVLSSLNNNFLIDLNITELGLNLHIPQAIENTQDHINFFVNALFYDPFEPLVNPPSPTNLPNYNSSHDAIEVAINQGSVNSLFWVLNNQRFFDIFVEGDNLPFSLPFKMEIDTKMFQLALPAFYNYYGENKVVDLGINSTDDVAPKVYFSSQEQSILLQLNESITFYVKLDNDTLDEAFTASFSFNLNITASINGSLLKMKILSLENKDVKLVKNKIPNLEGEIQGLSKLIDSLLVLAKGLLDAYLEAHPIAIPQIPGVSLNNLEFLVLDDNVVLSFDPIIQSLDMEPFKEIIRVAKKMVKTVKY